MNDEEFEKRWRFLQSQKRLKQKEILEKAKEQKKKITKEKKEIPIKKMKLYFYDNETDKLINKNICKYMADNNIFDYETAVRKRLLNYFVDKD